MDFLYAISGWQWVAAGLVPAGILALYFLKAKRKPLTVPSTLLWQKSIEDLRVNSLWQRLRHAILLFLQLAVAGFVILALLRPASEARSTGKHVILLIDNSASMAATDGEPTRLDSAKRAAQAIVERMEPGDAAMVIAFADSARVLCSYTQNGAELSKAIAGVTQTARRTDIHEALVIASGLANPQRAGEEDAAPVPATAIVLSDGNFPAVSELTLGNLSLEYVAIGTSGNNVAVAALAVGRHAEAADRWQVFARARNFGEAPVETTAELWVDGARADLQALDLGAGEERAIVFRLAAGQSAAIEVRLTHADALALDDRGWTVINPPREVKLLVVGSENPVLRAAFDTAALRALAEVEYRAPHSADDAMPEAAEGIAADLVIFDRCAPRVMPECNTLLLGALPPQLADRQKQTVTAPTILTWKSAHPILRFLNLDDVTVLEAFTIPLPLGADKLIESQEGAILFSVPRGIHVDVVQTFPLVGADGAWKTDWPLKLSFPLYVLNLVRLLAGAEVNDLASVPVGATVRIPALPTTTSATVTRPDGSSIVLKRTRDAFEFQDTTALGIYEARVGDERIRFAVNLFSEAESAIRPAARVSVGAVAAESTPYRVRREWWKPLVLCGLAVLLLEWYIYNRRVQL